MMHMYDTPVAGTYVADLKYAVHYPQNPCCDNTIGVGGKKSGGQVLVLDGTLPLRALVIYEGEPGKQVFKQKNQSVFFPKDLYIKGIFIYAVPPSFAFDIYKQAMLLRVDLDDEILRELDSTSNLSLIHI